MGMMMAVSFQRSGRLYYLDPGPYQPTVGTKVLVPTDAGPEVAECIWAPQWVEDEISGLPVSVVAKVVALGAQYQDQLATAATMDPATQKALLTNPGATIADSVRPRHTAAVLAKVLALPVV